jgi:hypothetical protein
LTLQEHDNTRRDTASIVKELEFDPQLWLKWFPVMIGKGSSPTHKMRQIIGRQTVHAFENFTYKALINSSDYVRVSISRDDCVSAAKNTKKYANDYLYTHNKTKRFKTAPVRVFRGDCIEAALVLQNEVNGARVAVLNMANKKTPGGGFYSGSGAQGTPQYNP